MQCGRCGKEIPKGSGVIPHDHPTEIFCNECGTVLYKCPMCVHSTGCLINKYNGPLPKMVVKTIQQGPMVLQQQIINPDLINECCPQCVCGSAENCQIIGTCNNYKGYYEIN